MAKAIIESVQLRVPYFENGIQHEYLKTVYRVCRASDSYPIRDFNNYNAAEDYVKSIENGEVEIN